MSSFNNKIRLKGKVEEDLFFAKINQALIEKIHKGQRHHQDPADPNAQANKIADKDKH